MFNISWIRRESILCLLHVNRSIYETVTNQRRKNLTVGTIKSMSYWLKPLAVQQNKWEWRGKEQPKERGKERHIGMVYPKQPMSSILHHHRRHYDHTKKNPLIFPSVPTTSIKNGFTLNIPLTLIYFGVLCFNFYWWHITLAHSVNLFILWSLFNIIW